MTYRLSAAALYGMFVVFPICASFVACSSSKGGSPAKPADASASAAAEGGDGVMRTYAPTYTAVWDEILTTQCAIPFCHTGLAVMPLSVGKDESYSKELVNVPASGPMCLSTGMKRVDPGHPESSLLYLKLTNSPCGTPMPYATKPLAMADIMQINEWITQGAQND